MGPASPCRQAARDIRRCAVDLLLQASLGCFFLFLSLPSHLHPRILKESDKEIAKVGS